MSDTSLLRTGDYATDPTELLIKTATAEYKLTDKSISDLTADTELVFDPAIALNKLSIVDVVPTTNPTNQSLAYIYLYAIATTQIKLPEEILFDDPAVAPMVFIYGGEFLNNGSSQLFWQYPDGGIPVVGEPLLRYVPMASRYAVDAAGVVYDLSSGTPVIITAGHNRSTFLLESDPGNMVEVDLARMMIHAFGKYNEVNFLDQIIYLDGDSTNLDITNLTLDRPDHTGSTESVDDLPRVIND